MKNNSATLFNKKLRYYARFIVVCLLQNKRGLVNTLLQELNENVKQYMSYFSPRDSHEWQLVLIELETFLRIDSIIKIGDLDQLTYRSICGPGILDIKENRKPLQRLKDAILVGNRQKQVKFSELTLDIYRMMQALETDVSINWKSIFII